MNIHEEVGKHRELIKTLTTLLEHEVLLNILVEERIAPFRSYDDFINSLKFTKGRVIIKKPPASALLKSNVLKTAVPKYVNTYCSPLNKNKLVLMYQCISTMTACDYKYESVTDLNLWVKCLPASLKPYISKYVNYLVDRGDCDVPLILALHDSYLPCTDLPPNDEVDYAIAKYEMEV